MLTSRANVFGAHVELLHVVEDPCVSGAWSAEAFVPNLPELLNALVAGARRQLAEWKALVAVRGIRVETAVVTGQPTQSIVDMAAPGLEGTRRAHVEERVGQLTAGLAGQVRAESLVLTGEPSEEIVKLADARQANLTVMGLHSAGLAGPRMGSVTYRVLCLTRALVLAIPPGTAASVSDREHATRAQVPV